MHKSRRTQCACPSKCDTWKHWGQHRGFMVPVRTPPPPPPPRTSRNHSEWHDPLKQAGIRSSHAAFVWSVILQPGIAPAHTQGVQVQCPLAVAATLQPPCCHPAAAYTLQHVGACIQVRNPPPISRPARATSTAAAGASTPIAATNPAAVADAGAPAAGAHGGCCCWPQIGNNCTMLSQLQATAAGRRHRGRRSQLYAPWAALQGHQRPAASLPALTCPSSSCWAQSWQAPFPVTHPGGAARNSSAGPPPV